MVRWELIYFRWVMFVRRFLTFLGPTVDKNHVRWIIRMSFARFRFNLIFFFLLLRPFRGDIRSSFNLLGVFDLLRRGIR